MVPSAAAALLVLVLAGCGGDAQETSGDPASPTSPESSSSPAEAAPTEEPVPTIAPAAGALLEVEGLRVHAPLSFSALPDQSRGYQVAFVPYVRSAVSVYTFPNISDFTVDESARATLRDGPFPRGRGRRLDDVVLDGETVFHLAGPLEDGGYGERFGAVFDGGDLALDFGFHDGEPPAFRQEVIDSVLATVDFGAVTVELPEPGTVAPPPASGPRIAIPAATLRAPMYWVDTDLPGATFDAAFRTGVANTAIVLSTQPQGKASDLERLGEVAVRSPGWTKPATRLDDTEVDGLPAVHVAGKVAPGTYVEQLDMLVDGQRLTLTFTFAAGESKQFRDDAIAQVLPTVRIEG
jgi:hypothetical protein